MTPRKPEKISIMLNAVEKIGINNLLSDENLKFDFRLGKNSLGHPICIAKSEINLDKLPVEVFAFMVGAMKNHRVALINLKSDGSPTNNIRIQHNLSENFSRDPELQSQVKNYTVSTIKKALDAELNELKAAKNGMAIGNPFKSIKPDKPGFFERIMSGLKKERDLSSRAIDMA